MHVISGEYEPKFIVPLQLPVSPIIPPDPEAEAYGMLRWDLPPFVDYVPNQVLETVMEAWNPTETDRHYAAGYYFIDPQGAVVTQDYLYFTANGMQFASFILHAGATEPLVTVVMFEAPGTGYRFGLQLLEVEMVNSTAVVKRETSRVEVLLGGNQVGNGSEGMMAAVSALLIIALLGVTVKNVTEGGTT